MTANVKIKNPADIRSEMVRENYRNQLVVSILQGAVVFAKIPGPSAGDWNEGLQSNDWIANRAINLANKVVNKLYPPKEKV